MLMIMAITWLLLFICGAGPCKNIFTLTPLGCISTGITVFRLQINNTGMSSNVMLLPYSWPCGTCNYAFMCGSWGYQIILWASWGGGFKLEFYWMTVKFQIILADFLCQESRKIKQKHN